MHYGRRHFSGSSDGSRIDPGKPKQSFSANEAGMKPGGAEEHACIVCNGRQIHVMRFDIQKGESPGHTHGEGIEQIPGMDDAARTARSGQSAYVITKTAAYAVEATGEGYRVRVISGTPPDKNTARKLERLIETWNSNQGTGGAQCTPGC